MDFSGSPNAGVYAEDANNALDAYNTAVNNVAAQRSQLYNQEGFNPDGSVDGTNLTGGYQQLQRSEGQALEAQHETDAARGIGSAGIAAQNGTNLRYSNGVDQANFANTFLNNNATLTGQQTSAYNTYQQALLNLQLQAIADADADQNYPGSTSSSGDGGGSSPLATNQGVQNAGFGNLQTTQQLNDIAKSIGAPKPMGAAPAPAPSTPSKKVSDTLVNLIAKKVK